MPPVLEVEGLDVVRDRLWVVRDVSLMLAPGEVLALLGGPAAGKSVFLEALALGEGVRAGCIRLAGRTITRATPLQRRHAGLACAFAEPPVVPGFAVADHVAVGASAEARGRERMQQLVRMLPELLPLWRCRLEALPLWARRLADLGRALMAASKVLLIDRPVADFGEQRLRRLLPQLRAQGVAVLLADRQMRPLLQLADRAIVLIGGQIACEGPPRELLADERVIAACLGDRLSAEAFADSARKATARTPAGRRPKRG